MLCTLVAGSKNLGIIKTTEKLIKAFGNPLYSQVTKSYRFISTDFYMRNSNVQSESYYDVVIYEKASNNFSIGYTDLHLYLPSP